MIEYFVIKFRIYLYDCNQLSLVFMKKSFQQHGDKCWMIYYYYKIIIRKFYNF